MDQTTLVDIDIGIGAEMIRALDDANLKVNVALWVNLSEYNDWRVALSSRALDENSRIDQKLVDEAFTRAGIPFYRVPSFLLLRMSDPFIRTLRRTFGKTASVEGMRLGGQMIGDRFVNGAYVYRIK